MSTIQVVTKQSNLRNGQEPTKIQRRTLITAAALAALLPVSGRVVARESEESDEPKDPFILLLKGLYEPVPAGHGPDHNLGLSTVNLSDGSYSKTKIYSVFGTPEREDRGRAIGTFYASLVTGLVAYDLPGGAIAMQFIAGGTFPKVFPDGKGGQYDEGTIPLTILEATGIYGDFRGGHNHMVDKLHQLVAGAPFAGFPGSGYNEFCFCIISQYPFPP
jgi:hypothetical protein